MKAMRVAVLDLVRRGRERDLAGVEVLVERAVERRFENDGRRVVGAVAERRGMRAAVRAYADERHWGRAEAEIGGLDELDAVLDAAVAAVAEAPREAPPPRLDGPDRGLSIRDPRQDRLDDATRRDVLAENLADLYDAEPAVREARFAYREVERERAVATSRGFDGVERDTRYRVEGSARGEGSPHVVRVEVESRLFSDVAARPLGGRLALGVAALRKPASPPAGEPAVVLSQPVAAALLRALAPAFDAEAIEDGRSFLARFSGPDAPPVGSALVHVHDDATIPGGLETRGFDGRGVPPVVLPLLKEGRLGAVYLSPRAARARDVRPSGHHHDDGRLWPGNLVVRPGNRSRNMIFPLLDGIVVLDELDAPPAVDLARGTVSLLGRAFAAGPQGITGFIGLRRLRATAPELLGAVTHVLNDHERHGSVDTPTWVLQGLRLSDPNEEDA